MNLGTPRNSTEKSTLAQQAYDELRHLIVLGKLTQRERLSEIKLAERLEISRTPVREAIRMLEQDGLVSRDSMGAYVAALSKKEASDLYRVRIDLEGLAVRLATENDHPDQRDGLRLIIQQIENLRLDRANLSEVIKVNGEFHNHIAAMSNNFYLTYTLLDIRNRLSLLRAHSLMASKRSGLSMKEHLGIAHAILDHQDELAVRRAMEHSKKAAEYAISSLFV